MKTVVVFRKWPKREGGEILALFPEEPGTREWWTCSSYMHVGQHAPANYAGCMTATRPAQPAEYEDLARELRRVGYKLDIRTRATSAMHAKRRAALA